MANLTSFATNQRGVVLITALIMVIAVTGIAVTLMSSSSIDIKITNAAQEREVAENQLIGEVQRVISQEANNGSNNKFFYTPEEVTSNSPSVVGMEIANHDDMTSNMVNLNKGVLDLECPRRFSFTAGISCNMVQVSTTIEYGSKSKHEITIVTGIAQEMASLSKGI